MDSVRHALRPKRSNATNERDLSMEWVETTGRTIDEAKSAALDQLGVAETDAEFEILDEPKAGLFGRMRGEARVRGRVRPVQPRQKAERRDRRPKIAKDDTAAPAVVVAADVAAKAPRTPRAPKAPKEAVAAVAVDPASAGTESESAAAFLSGLATAFGYESTTEAIHGEGGDMEVRLQGADLGPLIGPRGQTLQAVQELTRLVAQPYGRERSGRLHVDIGGYRERRREALARFTTQIAEEVRSTGQSRMLEPMSAPDRKVVHDTAATLAGVSSRSEGEDPQRRVVLDPDNG
jgi:spoIIIJ-associated protein